MLGLFGPKSGKIGVYKAAFIYQGPLKEDFSAGSPAINEVVLGSWVNKGIGEEGPGSLKAIPRPRTMKVVPLLTGFVSHTLLCFGRVPGRRSTCRCRSRR